MTVIGTALRKAATRAQVIVRQGLCLLLLVAAVIPVLTAGTQASASPATVAFDPSPTAAQADGTALPPPLRSSSNYSGDLNAQITSFGQQIAALPQRARALEAEKRSLSEQSAAFNANSDAYNTEDAGCAAKITAHNAKVDAHNAKVARHNAAPHVFQLPTQAAAANAYSAEKAQLDAESSRLRAEWNSITAEKSRLSSRRARLAAEKAKLTVDMNAHNAKADALKSETQRLELQRRQLLQQITGTLQNLIGSPPTTASAMARGGDGLRPPNPAGHSADTAGNGGDRPSRVRQNNAVDAYAREHGVKVDNRPVTAYLSPDSVSRLAASQAGRLSLVATFDGLVRKPNGHYKALEVHTAGLLHSPGQAAFTAAIANGGQATAIVEGKRKLIDEVESVSACQTTPKSFPADGATLHATDRHPFWGATTGVFTDAAAGSMTHASFTSFSAAGSAGDPMDCGDIKVLDGHMGRERLGSDLRYHLKEGDTEIQIDDPNNLSDTITEIDLVRDGVLWENKTVTRRKLPQDQLQKWVDKHVGKKVNGYDRARPILAGYEDAPVGIRFEDPTIVDINPGLEALVRQRITELKALHPDLDIRLEWPS